MSTLGKLALFGVVGLIIAVLFIPGVGTALTRFFTAPETIVVPAGEGMEELELELVTLLGYNSIPAILDPSFVPATEAAAWMRPDEKVLGLSVNGDNRAYSIGLLSRHEIVNDTVGGVPVALTW
jgi:hypothetical protein